MFARHVGPDKPDTEPIVLAIQVHSLTRATEPRSSRGAGAGAGEARATPAGPQAAPVRPRRGQATTPLPRQGVCGHRPQLSGGRPQTKPKRPCSWHPPVSGGRGADAAAPPTGQRREQTATPMRSSGAPAALSPCRSQAAARRATFSLGPWVGPSPRRVHFKGAAARHTPGGQGADPGLRPPGRDAEMGRGPAALGLRHEASGEDGRAWGPRGWGPWAWAPTASPRTAHAHVLPSAWGATGRPRGRRKVTAAHTRTEPGGSRHGGRAAAGRGGRTVLWAAVGPWWRPGHAACRPLLWVIAPPQGHNGPAYAAEHSDSRAVGVRPSGRTARRCRLCELPASGVPAVTSLPTLAQRPVT